MKVLQLCNKPPLPMIDGGCIAMNTISQGLLKKGIDLKIITVSTTKHPFLEDEIPAEFKQRTRIEGVFLDTSVNVIDAFSALVTADSYNVNRFFSTDFDRKLIDLFAVEDFDIVHLESLFMTPYIGTIRKLSKAKIILRSHNLEHLIWERLANSTGNKAKKLYLRHLASKLKKYEERTINEVDGIAAISTEDTQRFLKFKCKKPLVTVPFGIELAKHEYVAKQGVDLNNFFHIGAMNWEPNKEGVNWFLDEIWPLVKHENLKFHLAGRNMPKNMVDMSSHNLIIHGEVENAHAFMVEQDIMIVPLLSGSGIRIKIIEAMATGKAVISTKVGAEGISCTHDVDIIIADSAQEIAAAMVKLSQDPEKVKLLGKNARDLIAAHYDNSKIMDNLLEFYQS